MRPIDLTENNAPITPEQVAHPVGCGGTCGGKCGSKKGVANEGLPVATCGPRASCCSSIVPFLMALLLSGGIAYAGYAIGCGIHSISAAQRSISVRGFAEREVKADLAIWNIGTVATGNDLAAVQNKVESDRDTIQKYLNDNGIGNDEIIELPTSMTDLLARDYRSDNSAESRYIVNSGLRVRSNKVDVVKELSGLKIGALIKANVTLKENQQPVYLYTKLKDIKPEMVAEATKDARAAASQFAKDSGAHLGGMKSASQGVFQFLPRDQADNAMESAEINKTVRVVTTTDYFLAE